MGFDLPLELFRPEIEFPLPISLSRSVSQTRDRSLHSYMNCRSFVCCRRAKRGLKLSESKVLALEIILWVERSRRGSRRRCSPWESIGANGLGAKVPTRVEIYSLETDLESVKQGSAKRDRSFPGPVGGCGRAR